MHADKIYSVKKKDGRDQMPISSQLMPTCLISATFTCLVYHLSL